MLCGVAWQRSALLLTRAEAGSLVLGPEAILFQTGSGGNSVVKAQGLLAWVTETPRHHLRKGSPTKYKQVAVMAAVGRDGF